LNITNIYTTFEEGDFVLTYTLLTYLNYFNRLNLFDKGYKVINIIFSSDNDFKQLIFPKEFYL